jgi:hypothetical protein
LPQFRENLPKTRLVKRAEFGEDVMSVYALREV